MPDNPKECGCWAPGDLDRDDCRYVALAEELADVKRRLDLSLSKQIDTDRELWAVEAQNAKLRAALPINRIVATSIERAKRWHGGSIHQWSVLEWAGAMCGEAGECANAAKKLKRLQDGIASINANDPDSETVRHFDDIDTAKRVVAKEVADTILYAVLVAAAVDVTDLEAVLREVFNRKSEEYGFPERLAALSAHAAEEGQP